MNIKIQKLYEDAKIPTKAHDTDACFDIYAYFDYDTIIIDPNTTVKLKTGFATEIPEGYYCEVYARSGLGIKQGLRPANCVGIIDSDYRGEWVVALHNDSNFRRTVNRGDRIAQFAVKEVIPCVLEEVTELSATERGDGGIGSTGLNKNKKILIDLDNVMTDLATSWVEYLDSKYELEVKKEDIKSWEITKFFPTLTRKQIFEPLSLEEFWKTIKPIHDSQKYISALYAEGFDIYVVTSTNYNISAIKIDTLVSKYFPYIDSEHIILTPNKQMIKGDILIDDNPDNLIGGDYEKILFNQPHNEDFYLQSPYRSVPLCSITRVNGWKDCYEEIHFLCD